MMYNTISLNEFHLIAPPFFFLIEGRLTPCPSTSWEIILVHQIHDIDSQARKVRKNSVKMHRLHRQRTEVKVHAGLLGNCIDPFLSSKLGQKKVCSVHRSVGILTL